MTVKLLFKHNLEFLSLTGGCTGSSEVINVKMPHCWKSHVMVHLLILFIHIGFIVFASKVTIILECF